MQSVRFQETLAEFVQQAGTLLHGEIAAGAEVPFELDSQVGRRGFGGPSLYCYRPLVADFILERQPAIKRLAGYELAIDLLSSYEGLDRYLAGAGVDPGRATGPSRAAAAIRVLLSEVFAEQSDFELRPERLQAALGRLDQATNAHTGALTLVATLHGLTIASPELQLTRGLTIAHPDALEGLPEAALVGDESEPAGHLVAVLSSEQEDPRRALAEGRAVIRDLLRALRLFGDGRVTLGALAWSRIGGGGWSVLALGAGGRPHGVLVVSSEQEDELRAFCNLVSRRAPHHNELAWALRRFELGCEREDPYEALSDTLLALRALLEPEGPASGLLAGRLAALCATPEQRLELTQRALAAVALERETLVGSAVRHDGGERLARDMADHLRALLRDVICGHLDADLSVLADEILLEPVAVVESAEAEAVAVVEQEVERDAEQDALELQAGAFAEHAPAHTILSSAQQVLGDPAESLEVLDLSV